MALSQNQKRFGAIQLGGDIYLGGKKSWLAPLGYCLGLLCSTASLAQSTDYSQETYGPPVSETDMTPQKAPANIPDKLAKTASLALGGSPQILASKAELLALDADYRGAKWLRFPSLTAEALATTGGSNVADTDGLAINLALEQPIWSGGGINNRIDAARASRQIGYTTLREVRLAVLLGTIDAYYDVLAAQERAATLEQSLEDYTGFLASAERRYAQGVAPLTDLRLARTRVRQAQVNLGEAHEARDAAMLRLIEFAGAQVPLPELPQSSLIDDLPIEQVIMPEALACNPTINTRRSQIELAQAQRREAKSDLFPQLLLQLSQNEITGSRAAIVLRAQTGNGLSRFTAVESADARILQATADLGQADRELRRQISSEYLTMRTNRQRTDIGAEAIEAAQDLQASYQRQFVAGRRSWLDLLNSVREVSSAKLERGDSMVSAAKSATRILALSCRWRIDGVIEAN